MYDDDGYFVDNPIDRYTVNSFMLESSGSTCEFAGPIGNRAKGSGRRKLGLQPRFELVKITGRILIK